MRYFFRSIMKFVLKPSLEHMVLVKISVSLGNQSDVRGLIAKHCFRTEKPCSIKYWEEVIECSVIEKVPQLSLPQALKEKLLSFIKPIGLEVFKWIEFHCTHFHLCVNHECLDEQNLSPELCWTPQGAVDRKRTAEVLVRNGNLDISIRYKLACIFCLEDDIIQLWNNMTEDLKESDWDEYPIFRFWSRNRMGRGLDKPHISYKDVFCQCVYEDNKVAAEYFLQKLTPREREESLVKTAKHWRLRHAGHLNFARDPRKYILNADVLCFLLAKMDEELQMEVFKNEPYEVLSCFLQWPFQGLFIGVVNCMWDFLSEEHYDRLLIDIVFKVRKSHKDWNYQKLFGEFWQESPKALKSVITNEIDKSWLLPLLFHIKDKENIRLILKDTSFTVKQKLIYSDEMYTFCESSIRDNEWDFLEFCIRECFSSKSDMLKFKKEFEKYMSPYFKEHFATKKLDWEQLFRLSDGSIFTYDKRSIEDGESSSSKKFHSVK